MTGTRGDLSYTVRVQDKDLKRLAPILRQVRNELKGASAGAAQTGRTASTSMRRAAAETRLAEREVGRFSRGMLAATGIAKSFGRSIAFSSLAFLGGAGITAFLKSTVKDAQEAEKVQKQMVTQFKASGISLGAYSGQVERAVQAQSRLAAVEDEDVQAAFTNMLRTTKDVTKAIQLNALALDIAAARHMDVERTGILVSKVYAGNVRALTRYGIVLRAGMTPTQALMELQRRFAGQAEAVGKTSEGSAHRFGVAWGNVKEAIGTGVLAFLSSGFNKLADDVSDPKFMVGAKALGDSVGKDIGNAVSRVVDMVKRNWPAIVKLFHDAEFVARMTAQGLRGVAAVLSVISKITPGGSGTLLGMIATGLLMRKVMPVGGAVRGIGTSSIVAGKMMTSANITGKLAFMRAGALGVGAALGGWPMLIALSLPLLEAVGKRMGVLAAKLAGFSIKGDPLANITASEKAIGERIRRQHAAGKSLLSITSGLRAAGVDDTTIRRALAVATGAGIEDGGKKGTDKVKGMFGSITKDFKTPPTDAQAKAAANRMKKALEAARKTMDDAFNRVSDKALSAFDQITSDMADKLRAVVRVGRVSFTITSTGKTPAERELDAIERLQAKRSAKRDVVDTRAQLAAAIRFGDPRMIREARRKLEDAQLDQRKVGLEARAKVERTAADQSLLRARKEFEARRALQREHFSDELAAIQKRLDAGKLKEKQARKEIVATLKKYGIDLRTAGAAMGQAFSTGLVESLDAFSTSAGRADRVLGRILAPARVKAAQALARALTKMAVAMAPTGGAAVVNDAASASRHDRGDGTILFTKNPKGSGNMKTMSSGGGDTHIYVAGSVITERDLADKTHAHLKKKAGRNPRKQRGERKGQNLGLG